MTGITDPSEAYFKDGLWAWDGTRWRKQPLQFGFSELAGENLSNTNLAAGLNNLNGAAVAAGELLIVRQVALMYVGTPPTLAGVYVAGAPGTPYVAIKYNITSARWYVASCFLVLEAGDFVTCLVDGATATDDLYFRYSGYKMSIVE